MITIGFLAVEVIGANLAKQVKSQNSVGCFEGLGPVLNLSVSPPNCGNIAHAWESTKQSSGIASIALTIADADSEDFSKRFSLRQAYLKSSGQSASFINEQVFNPYETVGVVTRPSWQQLIVIGNGFDLECNLPSKFKDFFSSRYDVITHAEDESSSMKQPWGAYLASHGLTMWDVILQRAHKEYWYDVERAIADWVDPPQEEKPREEWPPTPIQRVLDNIKQFVADGRLSNGISPDDFVAIKGETSSSGGVIRFMLDSIGGESIAGWTESDIFGYFFDELNRLEREFGAYLQDAVNAGGERYKVRCVKLFIDLIVDSRVSKEHFIPEESFLSFNYTHPVNVLTFRKDGHPIPMVNVHGSLGSEIVLGIDDGDRMHNPNALRFTKIYGFMALGNPDLGKLVHGKGPGVLAGPTDVLKFYGHSLSVPDYSYFQAIFDTVGLYDGDTTIIFYYRPWKQKDGTKVDEQVARADMMDKVMRLLNSYGQTMENKAHGRNILHKLLIEGRLMVKLLPSAGYHTSRTDTNGLTYM